MNSIKRGLFFAALASVLASSTTAFCAQHEITPHKLIHEMPWLCEAQMVFEGQAHNSDLYRSMSIWSWRIQALIIDALFTVNAEQKSQATAEAHKAVEYYKAYIDAIHLGSKSLKLLDAQPQKRDELRSQFHSADLLTREGDLLLHETIKTAQQLVAAAQCSGEQSST